MNINWTIGKRLAGAFGVLLIIQIIVGVLAYYDVGQLSANISWITHTDQVVFGLDAIRGDLMQAETAGRRQKDRGRNSRNHLGQSGRSQIRSRLHRRRRDDVLCAGERRPRLWQEPPRRQLHRRQGAEDRLQDRHRHPRSHQEEVTPRAPHEGARYAVKA